MDFNWENYLKLAKSLQKVSVKKDAQIEEACHRTAISRAYYAIYHSALKFAENEISYIKITKNAGLNHTNLPVKFIEWSNKHGIAKYKKLAIILRRTRSYRTKSDYDDNIGKTKPLMDVAISETEDAFRIIDCKKSIK